MQQGVTPLRFLSCQMPKKAERLCAASVSLVRLFYWVAAAYFHICAFIHNSLLTLSPKDHYVLWV